MLDGVDLADIHGQHKFNFQHAAISREESKQFLDWAFRRDFERNGPSIYRICRTTLERLAALQERSRLRACARASRGKRGRCSDGYAAALWAMEKHLRATNPAVSAQIRELRQDSRP